MRKVTTSGSACLPTRRGVGPPLRVETERDLENSECCGQAEDHSIQANIVGKSPFAFDIKPNEKKHPTIKNCAIN